MSDIALAEGILRLADTGDAGLVTDVMSSMIPGSNALQLAFLGQDGSYVESTCRFSDRAHLDRLARDFSTPETNPVIARLADLPPNRFAQVEDFVDQNVYFNSEFYDEMIRPLGNSRVAMMTLWGAYGGLSLGLCQDNTAQLQDAQKTRSIALQIQHAMEMFIKKDKPEACAILLDGAGCAVGESTKDVGRNSLGALRATSAVSPVEPARQILRADFRAMFQKALAGAKAALVLIGDNGPVHATLQPGPVLRNWPLVWVETRALIAPNWTAAGLGAAFGLTPRESSVTLLLLRGKTVDEIADNLNLSARSVRTYLSVIFQKTGTNGQLGVVAKLLGAEQNG